MKIIIGGAGAVGTHLSKLLSKDHQDCVLIDDQIERLAGLESKYDIMTLHGSPTSIHTLKEAGAEHADRKEPAVLFHLIVPEELAADDLRAAYKKHGNGPDQEPDGGIESDRAHRLRPDIIAGKEAGDDSVDLADCREKNLNRQQAEQESVYQIDIRLRL